MKFVNFFYNCDLVLICDSFVSKVKVISTEDISEKKFLRIVNLKAILISEKPGGEKVSSTNPNTNLAKKAIIGLE